MAGLEHVDEFALLGSTLQSNGAGDAEIARRLRAAGDAWRRFRPTCFRGRLLAPKRKFRIYSTFVLSRLMYGAELWRARAAELRPVRRFYNRCLRSLVGHNLWTMGAKHVTDEDRSASQLALPVLRRCSRAPVLRCRCR